MEPRILGIISILIASFWSYSQSPVKDFYLKKSLKQDGFQYQFTVLDGDKHGVWSYKKEKFYYWYKAQKVMTTQGGASGQLLDGSFEAFHENKQLAQKGKFHKGLKDGQWKNWRQDGTLISIENWDCGDLKGTCEYFNEKGVLTETVRYKFLKTTRSDGDSLIVERKFEKLSFWKKDKKDKSEKRESSDKKSKEKKDSKDKKSEKQKGDQKEKKSKGSKEKTSNEKESKPSSDKKSEKKGKE